MEKWMPCKEIPTYELSSTGRVRNSKTGRILRKSINQQGYEIVQLHDNGKPYSRRVHRLVADAFYDDGSPDLDVDHLDGNKRNNNVDNLEWCTRKENTIRSYEKGLSWSHKKKKVQIIETGEIYDSVVECADALGVSRWAVGKCLSGDSKTCCGYHIVLM